MSTGLVLTNFLIFIVYYILQIQRSWSEIVPGPLWRQRLPVNPTWRPQSCFSGKFFFVRFRSISNSPTDPLPHFLSHLECPFTPVLLLFRREATSTDYFVRPPHPPDMTNLLDERTYIFPRSTFLMELFSNILFPSL